MAWEKEMITVTCPTQVNLSALQYYFVKKVAGLIVAVTAATDIPFGVLQNKPTGTATQPASATVCILGITKINSDAALTEDAWIGPSADGQADAKTLGTDATEFICGRMLTTTTAVNAVGTAMINCITPHNAVTAN
jgi:hypothetical protein